MDSARDFAMPTPDGADAGGTMDDPGARNWLLGLTTLFLVVSLVLLSAGGKASHLVGYGLASVLAFGSLALYRRFAAERVAKVGTVPSSLMNGVVLAFLVTSLVLSWLHAYQFARLFG